MTGRKQRHRRRSQGEGSVFQRNDGKWAGILDRGWIDGKRRRRWVYGTTERQVLGKLDELRRAAYRGHNLAAPPRTFGNWLGEWIRIKERQGTRPGTLRGYRQLIRQHIKPNLGGKRLDKLTPTDLRRLIETKSYSGLSAATVRQIHGLIRNALGDAEREELVARNVAKAVRPPRMRREEAGALTVEEARRLVGVISGDRWEALRLCALTLGLRRGELLGLRWVDVGFDEATLAVRQALQRVDGHLTFVQPKTDRSRRTLPVPELTLAALRRHRRRQSADRLAAGGSWQDTGLVFTTTKGTPLEPRNVNRRWYELREAAGLDWLRLHDLRHKPALRSSSPQAGHPER
ncbi:MAG: site-specific integrase [Nocardioidaceae bacterium]